MKKFIQLSFITLTFLLVLPCNAIGEAGENKPLRLASDIWPPYTDVEGKPRRALDRVQRALQYIQLESQVTITSWEDVVDGLKSKRFDATAAMWRTPEREKYMLFSEPYLQNRLILIGRTGSGVEQLGITGLQNKRLALISGYAYGNILRQLGGVKLVYRENDAANFQAVYIGRADYALADELLVDEVFKNFSPRAQRFMLAGKKPVFWRPLHFAIRKDYPGAEQIIAAFNQAISKIDK